MRSNKLVGMIMIVLGVGLTLGGFVILNRPGAASIEPEPAQQPRSVVTQAVGKPQTKASPPAAVEVEELTSEEKGRKFEEYVVRKFSPNYFTVKEWRGDKAAGGIRAESSMNPDLEIEFRMGAERKLFAVECKWRKGFDQAEKPGTTWASEAQIVRYNEFQRQRDMPVFVVLGVGGTPDSPEELYIAKLDRLKYPRANAEYLKQFRREKVGTDFYFDSKKPELK